MHEAFMRQAIEEARMARHIGEVPVGAIVVYDGEVVGQGFNQPIHTCDASGHAEVVALRMAAQKLESLERAGVTHLKKPPSRLAMTASNTEVVPIAVHVRDPGNGNEPRSPIDLCLEVLDRDTALFLWRLKMKASLSLIRKAMG